VTLQAAIKALTVTALGSFGDRNNESRQSANSLSRGVHLLQRQEAS